MEVEIDQAVYQKATTAEESGEVERCGEGFVSLEELAKRDEEQSAEEPGAADAAGDSGFRELLEVVVVRVIDDFSIVLRFVGRENGLQRAESCAGVFVVEENAPGVLTHRGALAGGDFEILERGEAVENLFDAEPGNEEESEEEDKSTGEDVATAGAAQQRDQNE